METVPVVLIDLSSAQRQVLVALKRRGEASADELAADLSITASAVRQHLSALKSSGLIAARRVRGRPGRPADIYHGSHLGEALFARPPEELSVELLGDLEDEAPDLVPRVFERRRRRRVAQFRDRLVGKSLCEKVMLITQMLDAEGYMTHLEELPGGRFRLSLHSCAIWAVASRYGEACGTELEFLKEILPEAVVERVTHKVDGAHVCGYVLGPRSPRGQLAEQPA